MLFVTNMPIEVVAVHTKRDYDREIVGYGLYYGLYSAHLLT